MTFPLASPAQQAFTVDEAGLRFDAANSLVRPLSLAANFPLHFTNLVTSLNLANAGEQARGQTPEDLGYTSISAPLDQALLAPPWYGLVFTLDLGTLGALAGSAGLSVKLLAGWAPGATADDRPIYLGLQLPSARSAGIDWPLEGVLRLGFRSFQFEASDLAGGGRAYMLLLRRLALSILGWSFPPGNTDVYLFGNPNGDGAGALGWYAAYDNGKAATSGTPRTALPMPQQSADQIDAGGSNVSRASAVPAVVRRRRSGRRALPPTAGL
jgi:hypothetical protein